MQRRRTSGGGYLLEVSASGGQGIIEYVLIIAVIGLVIVFAGPGVAGAIRNQLNLVGNTVNNGTVGGVEGGASGGGSAGTDSATVQAAIAKDAKDWTLEEQKAVAEDIAAKGEASSAFAKAEAAMNAGTKFSMKLTDGQTLEYKIIGINHDDLADGSGKAGLTVPRHLDGYQILRERHQHQCRWLGEVGTPREDELRRDLEPDALRFPIQGEAGQEADEQR